MLIVSGIAINGILLTKNCCVMGNFQKLLVWQLAKELAVSIYKLTQSQVYSKDFGLRDQIQRSAVSIPSNIAEGDSLDTDKQSVRHFYIARGSTAELRTQLIISKEIGYITNEEFELFDRDCDKISAMLTVLIRRRME